MMQDVVLQILDTLHRHDVRQVLPFATVLIALTSREDARLPSRKNEAVVDVTLESAGGVAVDFMQGFGVGNGDLLRGDADKFS